MDAKIAQLWAIAIGLGLVAYAASRFRSGLGVIFVVIGTLLTGLLLLDLTDPAESAGLQIDFGRMYLTHTRTAAVAMCTFAIAGFLLGRRSRLRAMAATGASSTVF